VIGSVTVAGGFLFMIVSCTLSVRWALFALIAFILRSLAYATQIVMTILYRRILFDLPSKSRSYIHTYIQIQIIILNRDLWHIMVKSKQH
jgi:hypothetical protein